MQKIIESGNQAVVINGKNGYYFANLYVNTRNGFQNADITTLRWSGKTMSGAEKWAAKQLGLFKKNPVDTSLARYEKALHKFLDEEEHGIEEYKKLIRSLPVSVEGNKIKKILASIVLDEEQHAIILRRILYF
jgi:hypothetical protein